MKYMMKIIINMYINISVNLKQILRIEKNWMKQGMSDKKTESTGN